MEIYFACLSGCMYVCLYSIHVKTAELIKPNIIVGYSYDPRKVFRLVEVEICYLEKM